MSCPAASLVAFGIWAIVVVVAVVCARACTPFSEDRNSEDLRTLLRGLRTLPHVRRASMRWALFALAIGWVFRGGAWATTGLIAVVGAAGALSMCTADSVSHAIGKVLDRIADRVSPLHAAPRFQR